MNDVGRNTRELLLLPFSNLTDNQSLLSPVALGNRDLIHINIVLEPPFLLADRYFITAHHPLSHNPLLIKRPIFQPIASGPLACLPMLVLIPELHCDLQNPRQPIPPNISWKREKPCCR
jgi:hypothetical protein